MFYCKKRFGQNFLIDYLIIQNIVKYINSKDDEILIEIGPGEGAMTPFLLQQCHQLFAIEIDSELISVLNKKFYSELQHNKLILINKDVLKINFTELLNNYDNYKLKIVGNLPYNISTPLLFKLFTITPYIKNLESMHFLLQKEVAERLIATPSNHQYGKLSIMAQYHATINIDFYVDPTAFNPKPKVHSALVKLVPHKNLPNTALDYQHFEKLVTTAFSQRRKVLANALKNICNKSMWQQINIDPSRRAEQLSISDFVNISNFLVRDGSK